MSPRKGYKRTARHTDDTADTDKQAAKKAKSTPADKRKGRTRAPRNSKAVAAAAEPQDKMNTTHNYEAWFAQYQDFDRTDGQSIMDPSGFERLCQDVGFDMEGVLPIVLLWKLNATKMGEVSFSEWDAGLHSMKVHSLAQLKNAVEQAHTQFATDTDSYRAFYRRVFEYLKTDGQKSVQKESAQIGLQLIAAHIPVVAKFVGFLGDEACKTKVINKDQWSSLLELSRSLRPDMSNYDDNGAWPVLFDDFVEWAKAN